MPCALSRVQTQAIGALAHGFTDRATQAPITRILDVYSLIAAAAYPNPHIGETFQENPSIWVKGDQSIPGNTHSGENYFNTRHNVATSSPSIS